MIDNEKFIGEMTTEIMRLYRDQMNQYLDFNQGKLTEAEVIVLIMNIVDNVAINLYYSLKFYLPKTEMDFDFMRAKMINEISAGFEKIKEHKIERQMLEITAAQLQEIVEKDFCIVNFEGKERRVTWDDLMLSKEDTEKLRDETLKRIKEEKNTPKIIAPPPKKILHKKSKSS